MSPVALGLIAGAFTTFASLPQIIYVLRARSMKDISIITLLMFAVGVALWLVYGIVIHAMPVIICNTLSLMLYLTQIGLKLSMTAADAEPIFADRSFIAKAIGTFASSRAN